MRILQQRCLWFGGAALVAVVALALLGISASGSSRSALGASGSHSVRPGVKDAPPGVGVPSQVADSSTPVAAAAHVWVTTANGGDRLSGPARVAFSGAAGSTSRDAAIVVLDPTRRYQTMTGFGASITDASASVLYTLPAVQRARVMASLFSPTGDGLDFLRQPIGASDMVADGPYTYDDLPAGQTDYTMAHFSIAHDQARILPLLREAERLNPHLTVMTSPWSAPAWMKTSGSLLSGRLIASPQIYHAYALYLLDFIKAYRAQGVAINDVTVQNEPQDRDTGTYPGTDMPSWQEAAVIEDLGPMLSAAHLSTRVFAFDDNWSEDAHAYANTPSDEKADFNDYPGRVLATPAAQWISGVAFHCYNGDPSAMTAFHDRYPSLKIYQSECSGTAAADPAATFSSSLKWQSRYLEIGSTGNWSSTVVNWDLALNQAHGPHTGGCGTCTGVVTVGPGTAVTYNAEYYALGQLSRFVQPGAVRIGTASAASATGSDGITDVAFRNPSGSTVLVTDNDNAENRALTVQEDGRRFSYVLPADCLATFVWS